MDRHTTLDILQEKLARFGLNPLEWTLKPITKQIIKVVNKSDKDLYFIGTVQKDHSSHPKWKSMRLLFL